MHARNKPPHQLGTPVACRGRGATCLIRYFRHTPALRFHKPPLYRFTEY
jgi:hypothetical protein